MSSIALSLAHLIVNFQKATGRGPSFVGVTYTAKNSGETARYTFSIGTSYLNLLRKSLAELENVVAIQPTTILAKQAVKESIEKSIAAHERGEQSEDYTKRGMYSQIVPGVMEFQDGTCEIAGVVVARKVLIPGIYKQVNSSPMTLAKKEIEKQLSKSKYKTLCIDSGHLHSVRVGGNEIEVDDGISAHKDASLTATKAKEMAIS